MDPFNRGNGATSHLGYQKRISVNRIRFIVRLRFLYLSMPQPLLLLTLILFHSLVHNYKQRRRQRLKCCTPIKNMVQYTTESTDSSILFKTLTSFLIFSKYLKTNMKGVSVEECLSKSRVFLRLGVLGHELQSQDQR